MGIFPDNIVVGLQNRNDTYTGKLGYVSYKKGKDKQTIAHKIDNWRDDELGLLEFDNVPTEGFVLNKSAGGGGCRYSWNGRTVKSRVYDPRGFEFEIDTENLHYILEFATSTKGKGLEGEFVYGWMGKGGVCLIPVESEAYMTHLANIQHKNKTKTLKSIPTKNLEIGKYYVNKNEEVVFFTGGKYGLDRWILIKEGRKSKIAMSETHSELERRISNNGLSYVGKEYTKIKPSLNSAISEYEMKDPVLLSIDLLKNNEELCKVFYNKIKNNIQKLNEIKLKSKFIKNEYYPYNDKEIYYLDKFIIPKEIHIEEINAYFICSPILIDESLLLINNDNSYRSNYIKDLIHFSDIVERDRLDISNPHINLIEYDTHYNKTLDEKNYKPIIEHYYDVLITGNKYEHNLYDDRYNYEKRKYEETSHNLLLCYANNKNVFEIIL